MDPDENIRKCVSFEEECSSGLIPYVPMNVTDFDEFEEAFEEQEKQKVYKHLHRIFSIIALNILDSEVEDKGFALNKLAEQFVDRIILVSEGIDVPEKSHVKNQLFIKSINGIDRVFGVFSNNYRDREHEILTEKSHVDYTNKVKSGEYPHPVILWHHDRSKKLGQVKMVGYDKDTGLTYIEGELSKEGSAYLKSKIDEGEQIGMSHGMVFQVRSSEDKSLIEEYASWEVSFLKKSKVANYVTSMIVGDEKMESNDLKMLKENGWDVAAILGNMGKQQELAETIGLDSKDLVEVEAEVEIPVIEEFIEVETEAEIESETLKHIDERFDAMFKALAAVGVMQKEQSAVIEELKSFKEEVLDTPSSSRKSLTNVIDFSDVKEKAATSAPGETKDEEYVVVTGAPFVDMMFNQKGE